MLKTTLHRYFALTAVVALGQLGAPTAHATTLYSNPLPNQNQSTGSGQSEVAPVYGSLADSNLLGDPSMPYILGDQFVLPAGTNSLTSFTIYEVGNSPTSGPINTPTQEFSALTLYIGGPDSGGQTALSQVATSYTYADVGTYFSIYSPNTAYPIFSITFSLPSLVYAGGYWDFAVGATPIAGNSFALLMGDPTTGYSGLDPTQTLGNGFLYFFYDAPGSLPLSTYEYAPGFITGYTDPNLVDALAVVNGTNLAPAPEPATMGIFGLGLGALIAIRRRRQ